jgi:hypothetical protein
LKGGDDDREKRRSPVITANCRRIHAVMLPSR